MVFHVLIICFIPKPTSFYPLHRITPNNAAHIVNYTGTKLLCFIWPIGSSKYSLVRRLLCFIFAKNGIYVTLQFEVENLWGNEIMNCAESMDICAAEKKRRILI